MFSQAIKDNLKNIKEEPEAINAEDNFDKRILNEKYDISEEDIADYIVENPEEIMVKFPIISNIKLEKDLPFFKSILYKLSTKTVFSSF